MDSSTRAKLMFEKLAKLKEKNLVKKSSEKFNSETLAQIIKPYEDKIHELQLTIDNYHSTLENYRMAQKEHEFITDENNLLVKYNDELKEKIDDLIISINKQREDKNNYIDKERIANLKQRANIIELKATIETLKEVRENPISANITDEKQEVKVSKKKTLIKKVKIQKGNTRWK